MSTPAQTAAIQRGTARSLKSRPLFRKFILWGGLILLLVIATIYYAGYRSGSGDECGNKKHQCTAERNEKVLVPEGKLTCFDSSYWDNLPQLGFSTSHKGGAWNEYSCTQEQVMSGVCRQRVFDAFRFNPKGEVRIPKYWFVPATDSC